MEGHRFDEISRKLAASKSSRRGLLGGATGGLAGGALITTARSNGAASAATICAAEQGQEFADTLIGLIARIMRAFGIPIPEPEPIGCPAGQELNPHTCECECALKDGDCRYGVDPDTCECKEIVCEQSGNDCGPQGEECSCGELHGTGEPVCVDRTSFNGHTCGGENDDPCPAGTVCAFTADCGTYCFPYCGDAASFAHIPDKLA